MVLGCAVDPNNGLPTFDGTIGHVDARLDPNRQSGSPGTNWYGPSSTAAGGALTLQGALQHGSGRASVGSNLKVYTSGWGGNQYVSTLKIAQNVAKAAVPLAAVSTVLDAVAWQNGTISTEKAGVNLFFTGAGFMGPGGAAVGGSYYLLEQFYPGGAQGALIDYGKNVEANQKIVPGWQAVPSPAW